MTAPFRLTQAGLRVLRALAAVDQATGFELARTARVNIGRAHPQLVSMERAGWVESWQDEARPGRNPLRYYRLTDHGRDHTQRLDPEQT